MASITIRNLDERVKRRLKIRAASKDCSMEEEARNILCAALAEEGESQLGLGETIRQRFAALGGVDLQLAVREPMPTPPDFDDDRS